MVTVGAYVGNREEGALEMRAKHEGRSGSKVKLSKQHLGGEEIPSGLARKRKKAINSDEKRER